jgi:hypothetical protein
VQLLALPLLVLPSMQFSHQIRRQNLYQYMRRHHAPSPPVGCCTSSCWSKLSFSLAVLLVGYWPYAFVYLPFFLAV